MTAKKFYVLIHGDCDKNSRKYSRSHAEIAAKTAAANSPGTVVHVMECVDAFMARDPEAVRVPLSGDK